MTIIHCPVNRSLRSHLQIMKWLLQRLHHETCDWTEGGASQTSSGVVCLFVCGWSAGGWGGFMEDLSVFSTTVVLLNPWYVQILLVGSSSCIRKSSSVWTNGSNHHPLSSKQTMFFYLSVLFIIICIYHIISTSFHLFKKLSCNKFICHFNLNIIL